MEKGLTKNQLISELSRSPHGKLTEYVKNGKIAAKHEPEFLAHLIAWDAKVGQVRDAKIALPVVSLSEPSFPEALAENSLAHLALLNPRELHRAYRFVYELRVPGRMKAFARLIRHYLKEKEHDSSWDRLALLHHAPLKGMYALSHTKPGTHAKNILFERQLPKGSIFEAVNLLKDMNSSEAAGTIMEWRIPFLVAMGALGKKAKDANLVQALIERMSPTELVTNTKLLERLGMKDNPSLRGAYEKALTKASSSKANVLKTTRAAESMTDETLKTKLRGMQDKQLASLAVDGNWLVLADKSGSMNQAIHIAREVSAVLAKMVKGKVWLVFFDTVPQTIDVTGASLDVIKKATEHITANGSTSIGCGLQRMLDGKVEIDGIAIVSDAGENHTPYFPDVYKRYCAWSGKDVPVYLYLCDGDSSNALINQMQQVGQDMQVFNMNNKADYYSLPNLVQTMRTNRYSLVDEVMNSRLLFLKDVFRKVQFKGKEAVA